MITHKAPRTCYIFLAACCYCQSTIKMGTHPNKINQRAQTVWGSLLVCPSNESSQSDPHPDQRRAKKWRSVKLKLVSGEARRATGARWKATPIPSCKAPGLSTKSYPAYSFVYLCCYSGTIQGPRLVLDMDPFPFQPPNERSNKRIRRVLLIIRLSGGFFRSVEKLHRIQMCVS